LNLGFGLRHDVLRKRCATLDEVCMATMSAGPGGPAVDVLNLCQWRFFPNGVGFVRLKFRHLATKEAGANLSENTLSRLSHRITLACGPA